MMELLAAIREDLQQVRSSSHHDASCLTRSSNPWDWCRYCLAIDGLAKVDQLTMALAASRRDDVRVENVTTAALKAGIVLRDLAGSMRADVLAAMPRDMRLRILSTEYQDSVDAMPEDIREAAIRRALDDPLIQEARAIHAEGVGK